MSSKPLLHHADFSTEFHVTTDSSGHAISDVLLQICVKIGKFVPVAYTSQALTPNEAKHSIYENEALACVFAVTSFAHYLSSRKFVLYCDNVCVKYLLTNDKKLSAKMTCWALLLTEFNFDIQYIKFTDHLIADCLSRMLYQIQRTSADDRIDVFPFLPGVDMVESETDEADSYVTEDGTPQYSGFPIELLAGYTCDYTDSSMGVEAMTRAQAAKEKEREIEIQKETELSVQQLPFVDSLVPSQDESSQPEIHDKSVKWRNTQLRQSQYPKRQFYLTIS